MPRRTRRLTDANANPAHSCGATRPGTPFTVIGGGVGAGKTTLIRRLLLEDSGRRVAAFVQDMTALRFPKAMIAYWDTEFIGLTNGNTYCSVTQGLSAALHDLTHRIGPPEQVLIEARANEELFPIIRFGQEMGLELDALLVVADAERLRALVMASGDGSRVMRQIHQADLVLLNKVDLLTRRQLVETRTWLSRVAPEARRLETVHAAAPVSLLISSPPAALPESPDQRQPETWGNCDAWCYESKHALDRDALCATLRALPSDIIRGDGQVLLTDEPGNPHVLQSIGRRVILKREAPRVTASPQTKITLLGLRGSVDAKALEKAMHGVLAPGSTSLRALSGKPLDLVMTA